MRIYFEKRVKWTDFSFSKLLIIAANIKFKLARDLFNHLSYQYASIKSKVIRWVLGAVIVVVQASEW
jgi:hypothetical protein